MVVLIAERLYSQAPKRVECINAQQRGIGPGAVTEARQHMLVARPVETVGARNHGIDLSPQMRRRLRRDQGAPDLFAPERIVTGMGAGKAQRRMRQKPALRLFQPRHW